MVPPPVLSKDVRPCVSLVSQTWNSPQSHVVLSSSIISRVHGVLQVGEEGSDTSLGQRLLKEMGASGSKAQG